VPRQTKPSINEESLKKLQEVGWSHPLIEARLRFVEANHLLSHYLRSMVGLERVYPRINPTLATGRWGTSDPPIPNLTADRKYGPHGIRDVVGPDPGEIWIGFDYEAIEGRLTSYDCKDQADIEAFEKGYEIHTLTACKMFHWPEPTVTPTKKAIFADQEYCAKLGYHAHRMLCRAKEPHHGCVQEPWFDDHRIRRLAKNCRYSLIYELVRAKGAAMRKYAFEMKMEPEYLQSIGAVYLDSKPGFTAWKKYWQTKCAQEGIARTLIYGRRRLLAGNMEHRAKEGGNHRIQGSVADIICTAIIQVDREFPELTLAYQSHDGLKWHAPATFTGLPRLKTIVEKAYQVGNRVMGCPADWKIIHPEE